MTPLQKYLSDVKARAEAATPGPWEYCLASGFNECTGLANEKGEFVCDFMPDWFVKSHGHKDTTSDMEFIAHSRTDIEKLLKLVEMAVQTCKQYADAPEDSTHKPQIASQFLQDAAKLVGEK